MLRREVVLPCLEEYLLLVARRVFLFVLFLLLVEALLSDVLDVLAGLPATGRGRLELIRAVLFPRLRDVHLLPNTIVLRPSPRRNAFIPILHKTLIPDLILYAPLSLLLGSF